MSGNRKNIALTGEVAIGAAQRNDLRGFTVSKVAAFDANVQRMLMTLTLRVTSYRGAPLPRAIASHFDARGGTIGRAPESDLCLPDQEKLISRSHATIKYRNNQYFILDHGR